MRLLFPFQVKTSFLRDPAPASGSPFTATAVTAVDAGTPLMVSAPPLIVPAEDDSQSHPLFALAKNAADGLVASAKKNCESPGGHAPGPHEYVFVVRKHVELASLIQRMADFLWGSMPAPSVTVTGSAEH